MNHTEPPWDYDPYDRVVVKEGVVDIAHMDRTASEADAKLITAAPELLSALIDLVHAVTWLSSTDTQIPALELDAMKKARDAIDRATDRIW